jgi:hypothetical protein
MNLKSTLIFIMFVFSYGNRNQLEELRRQYADYRLIFNKAETIDGFNIFVENLNRIANRGCDFYIDKTSDVELTHSQCKEKTL